MPLTKKGNEIMSAMKSEYGPDKGESVFYASRNKGTISGVDPESRHSSRVASNTKTKMRAPRKQKVKYL